MSHIELKIGAPLTHNRETILLAFSIEARWKIRAAPSNEKSIDSVEEPPPGSWCSNKGKDKGDAAQFFNGPNVSSPQKIRRFPPPHILPVTGIEVRRDADDRFHVKEPGCSSAHMKPTLLHSLRQHRETVRGGRR